ncbi:VOC family protein [Rhodococcus sp. NPDC056743]|uniref:VOC family protein n=1 Tax=Rhodococcus sp. NPDC056743 TaxID=3345934 RepID=UPI00366B0DBE
MTASSIIGRYVGVAIAVPDLTSAVKQYSRLGFVLSDLSYRTEWGAKVATFGFDDGSYLELISGVDSSKRNGAAIAAFVERFGARTYLSCYDVDDIGAAYDRVREARINVLGPPQLAPESVGERAEMLWLKPAAMGGAFTQLLQLHDGPRKFEKTTPTTRPFTQVLVASDFDPIVATLTGLCAIANPPYDVPEWGLSATVFELAGDTNIEISVPTDTTRPQGAALQRALDSGRSGHYMTTFEVDDVDLLAERFATAGVKTLGPPTDSPMQSPWGPCRQLWVHPAESPGTFIQFLTRLSRLAEPHS